MKVVLFWLFHWWREVLSPPKQFLKLDTMFNAVVSYCGVILLVVIANLSLFSVASAEVKYPRMSTNVKHVGINIFRHMHNGAIAADDAATLNNISTQIKKTVFGSETAATAIEGNCKAAQFSVQIEFTAKEYADDAKGTETKLEELINALLTHGFAVHLLLSLHYDIYDKDQAKFGEKTEKNYFQSKVEKTGREFTYGTYVPYKPCTDQDAKSGNCPYDVIFQNFHVPVIDYLRSKKLLDKIAMIYVYNEFDYGGNSPIEPTDKQALTETLSRTFDIAYDAANKEVPIGIKFQSIYSNSKSAWKEMTSYTPLKNLLAKDIVLGYDCYVQSSETQFCEEDKKIFLDAIGSSNEEKYRNGRIEIAEYGRFLNNNTALERTDSFMTNLVKSWSDSSGFSLFAFNATGADGMYSITKPLAKGGKNLSYELTTLGKQELERLNKQMQVVTANLSDVNDKEYYAKSIKQLCQLGVVSGYPDGTFGIDKEVTRAEFLKMVLLASNTTCDASTITTKFKDIKDHWASEYIKCAVNKKIVEGYEDDTFKPQQTVNRAEAAKMIVKAFELDESKEKCNFSDTSAQAWACPYMMSVDKKSIMKATTDNKFNPTREMKRAETATAICRAYSYKQHKNTALCD